MRQKTVGKAYGLGLSGEKEYGPPSAPQRRADGLDLTHQRGELLRRDGLSGIG